MFPAFFISRILRSAGGLGSIVQRARPTPVGSTWLAQRVAMVRTVVVSSLPNGRNFNLRVIRIGADAADTYTGPPTNIP